jgi:nucleoside-diphosphate-sugar epimerase
MKVLVVGGAGMIGGRTALHFKAKGHDVTVAGRNAPAAGTPLGDLPFARIDYVAMDFDPKVFEGVDAMVFAAGNDIRHMPRNIGDEYWEQANSIGIPRFFKAAKDAGVKTAVNIGSFYPQAAPQLVAGNAYVRSRKDSDEGVVALSDANFKAMSVNAPFVVGHVPGLVLPMYGAYVKFGEGTLGAPEFIIPGGVNFISAQSVAEACEGAILRGAGGASYLVGDENLSFREYFGAFFEAVGRPIPEVRNEEHPLLPDAALFFGRGNNLFYEPDAKEAALLGYRRKDVIPAIKELVAAYRST